MMLPAGRLLDVVPGQQPRGDRPNGDFGTLNKDQTVLIVVR